MDAVKQFNEYPDIPKRLGKGHMDEAQKLSQQTQTLVAAPLPWGRMHLFDAHCHLQAEALRKDLDAVLGRAAAAGVERMVCCGTSAADWPRVLELSEKDSGIVPMLGIHPWRVTPDWRREAGRLEALLRAHPGAGIGETGLDFQERFKNRTEQEESFAAHLDLARALHRPVAVHCVRAWGRLIEIVRSHPAPRILLHAFGGAPELIPELAALNGYFSFCGAVANPQFKRMRAAAAAVPLDRLLLETDSPDFSPPGYSAPNEPARLVLVLRAVAELRGLAPEALADALQETGNQFFG